MANICFFLSKHILSKLVSSPKTDPMRHIFCSFCDFYFIYLQTACFKHISHYKFKERNRVQLSVIGRLFWVATGASVRIYKALPVQYGGAAAVLCAGTV